MAENFAARLVEAMFIWRFAILPNGTNESPMSSKNGNYVRSARFDVAFEGWNVRLRPQIHLLKLGSDAGGK